MSARGVAVGSSWSARDLALLSTWVGCSAFQAAIACRDRVTSQSWVKTIDFTIARVSDPSGQFSGPGGQIALAGDVGRFTAGASAVIDAWDAGDERKEC
jgi:hypothetical protein